MEEIRGATPGATIEATFAIKSTGRNEGTEIALRDLIGIRAELASIRSERTSDCKVIKVPTAADEMDRATLLSAGKIFLTQANTSSSVAVPQDANGRYYKQLGLGLPTSLYNVIADGSEDVRKFEMSLSFPEPITQLTIGNEIVDDGIAIQKSSPLQLEWDQAAVPLESHIVMLELYSEQPKEIHLLRCLGMESDFVSQAKRKWIVPPQYMAAMGATNNGLLFLSRILARSAGNSAMTVEAQGFQTQFARVVLE